MNGEVQDFTPARDSSWKFMWIEASISRCHIRILSTIHIDAGNWEIRAGIDGENETKSVLIQGTYRVFKYQVYFLKVVQLGAPWTNLHKFFFSDFLKVYIFCQVTKKKDFYSITAATIAEC